MLMFYFKLNKYMRNSKFLITPCFIFIFICYLNSAYTQGLNIYIVDAKTNKGIPFASITNSQKTIGFISDSLGVFTIPDGIKFDSIIVSSIGYRSIKILQVVHYPIKIELEELPIVLKEAIVISRKKWKKIRIGILNRSDNGCYGGALNENNEVALFVDNNQKKLGKISKVAFYISHDGKYKSPFRIRIYENRDGKPDKEITDRNIVVHGYKRNSWNKFDLSKYDFKIPINGCFVSMEWLNIFKYRYELSVNSNEGIGQTIGLTSEFKESRGFMRSNGGIWYSSKSIFTIKETVTASESLTTKVYNPMIWIEILL